MSKPTPIKGIRPAKDKLVCLKQAVSILKLVEDLGRHGDFDDRDQVVDVVKSARKLIEESHRGAGRVLRRAKEVPHEPEHSGR